MNEKTKFNLKFLLQVLETMLIYLKLHPFKKLF